MYQRAVVLRVPRHTRSAATATKIQPARKQIPWSEADSAPKLGASRHIPPRFTSGQRPVEPAEHGRLRASTSTLEPQSDPRVTSRRPPLQFNESTSFRPSSTESSPLSRLSKLKIKERGSLRSGHAVARANNGSTMEIVRGRGKQKERDNGRGSQSKEVSTDLYIPSTVSVGQLAKLLNVRLRTLQRKMEQAGMYEQSSYDHVLTSDYAALLVQEFGRNPVINDEAAFDIYPPPPLEDPCHLTTRPPIVAIMGHVDHGKTTLLDNLRSSSVAASEAGGITQHIGAFCVPLNISGDSSPSSEVDERLITFLDTPGHAAFSSMRARGTSVTDIVVLVVAADDGVMPQTLEVIELVKREREGGNIGVVVAINKVDKPEADVEKTKYALLSAGLPLEEAGGDVPCVTVSGLTGSGLPELVETIALVADMMDLRVERDCSPVGYILESRMLKGFGPVATVLMARGTLSPGIPLLAGTSSCSTRRLLSSSLQPITCAVPGTPVLITGWKSLPAAGEEVLSGSDTDIKKACANRERKRAIESALGDVEAINATRQAYKEREGRENSHTVKRSNHIRTPVAEGGSAQPEVKKYLRMVVKGDVSGSVEALTGAVRDIGNHLAGVKIVSTGVGDVSDSDVMMAKAADAMIVAFSVGVPRAVRASTSQNHVPIYTSDIIYRVIDDIRDRVISLLPCTIDIKVTGEATVLQLFEIQIKGNHKKIAGCRVTHGILQRSSSVRVLRDDKVIYEGSIDALKHLKKDVTEVRKGLECGVNLQGFDSLQEGDVIQMFQKVEIPGEL